MVKPLFFPGGDIGSLAVSGTVNDLAVSGAVPRYLSVGMILEAGFEIDALRRIAGSIAETARRTGVRVVTGDTKVVERGHADGIYITTAGIGTLDGGWALPAQRVEPGDAVLVTGPIACHGMAVMAAREAMGFSPPIESDAKPLANLLRALLETGLPVHAMRDPTRGGVAATLTEWAGPNVDIVVEESALPLRADVRAACALLGMDPLFVANEGVALIALPEGSASSALEVLRRHPDGAFAARIAAVEPGSGRVLVRAGTGALRRVRMPSGELLPRIC